MAHGLLGSLGHETDLVRPERSRMRAGNPNEALGSYPHHHRFRGFVPRLLTVAGSLRAGSSNAALLTALGLVAPPEVVVSPYAALAELPAFNPDLEEGSAPMPAAVQHWRAALADADMVVISSPEYAHGIPGALKNALDWVVGSGELVGKPTGVISASAASRFAHPQLVAVLTVMSAAVIPAATIVIDVPRRGVDTAQLATDPTVAGALRHVLAALLDALPTSGHAAGTTA